MTRHHPLLLSLMILTAVASCAAAQETVHLPLLPSGAANMTGDVEPRAVRLAAERPATLRVTPDALTGALFGVLPVGTPATAAGRVFHVATGTGSDGVAVIRVDADGDGDMTDDPPLSWEQTPYGDGFVQRWVAARLRLGQGAAGIDATLILYMFDPKDTRRAAYVDTLFFFADWARAGTISPGGRSFDVLLYDAACRGDLTAPGARLFIDINGDGSFFPRLESVDAAQPFTIGGTTWEIRDMAPLGDSFRIARSSRSAPEMTGPPDLRVGARAPSFTARDTGGAAVSFPADFRGRIVMLDFWATWCGPCMQEIPGLVAAYRALHARGFEVLGISLDTAETAARLPSVTGDNGMSWRQVCDRKGWDAAVAEAYLVDSIPRAYLVDGDTGTILASGDSLRGTALQPTIAHALAAKTRH